MPTLPRILAAIGVAILVGLVFRFWLTWPGFLAVGVGAVFGVGFLIAATAIGTDPREEDAAWRAEAVSLGLGRPSPRVDITTLPSVGSYEDDTVAAERAEAEASQAIVDELDGGTSSAATPTEDTLVEQFEREGIQATSWSNGPNEGYAAHAHDYDKVIVVVRGSIAFGLPGDGARMLLDAGDRLELPAGTEHDALVGADGVTCLEAHLPAGTLAGAPRHRSRDETGLDTLA